VQLVIQAGAVGSAGEALVLDMGAPVRIAEVAQRLIDQADRPIAVVFTGLRPGEKLHEVLLGTGEVDRRPAHPLISHVPVPPLDHGVVAELHLDRGVDDVIIELERVATSARRGDPVEQPSPTAWSPAG
jgi:FlaA1/EpsC-like NDP-sugar epimerase